MMLSQDHPVDSHGWRDCEDTAPCGDEKQARRTALLGGALVALSSLAASPLIRQWLAHVLANICVIGGILAAPLVSVVAWIGLLLPSRAPLHQLAPTLVAGSLIWFALAIAGAHVCRFERRSD